MIKTTKSFRNRILIVIACSLIHLTLGSVYLWGTLSTYVNSYYHNANNNLTYK